MTTFDEAEERLRGARRLLQRLEVLQPVSGAKILDAGCGWGAGLLAAAELGAAHAVGVDLDLGFQHEHPFEGLALRFGISTDNVEMLQADLCTVQGYDGYFDAAVSMDSVEHVSDLWTFLAQIHRMLAAGGIAVIDCGALYYSLLGGHVLGYFSAEQTPWVHLYRDYAEMLDARKVDAWTRTEIRRLNRLTYDRLKQTLLDVGFEIIRELVFESGRDWIDRFRDRIDFWQVPSAEDLFKQWVSFDVRKAARVRHPGVSGGSRFPEPGPAVALSGRSGHCYLYLPGSDRPLDGGGHFASEPGVGHATNGDQFVVGLDEFQMLWANVYGAKNRTWGRWRCAKGSFQGIPAVAATREGAAFISARDVYSTYWIISYDPRCGFGSWIPLGGVFATDPVLAAGRDGSIHIGGRDFSGLLWYGNFVQDRGLQGWKPQELSSEGLVGEGRPAIAVATSGATCVAERTPSRTLRLARIEDGSWTGLCEAGGAVATDPLLAAGSDGMVWAVFTDSLGGVWLRGYREGCQGGWLDWRYTVITAIPVGVGVTAGGLWIAALDRHNDLWWYSAADQVWTFGGNIV